MPILTSMVNSGSKGGVYLFSGPESVGKATVARSMAKYTMCTNAPDDTCRCPACRAWPTNPDYLELSPGGESIGVDEVGQLDDHLSLMPFMSTRRSVLVDGAHKLTQAAANRLLKPVEDAVGDPLMVFVTSKPELIPKALLSRLCRVDFGRLSEDDVRSAVKASGVSSEGLSKIYKHLYVLPDGMVSGVMAYHGPWSFAEKLIDLMVRGSAGSILQFLEDLQGSGDLYRTMCCCVCILSDMLQAWYSGGSEPDTEWSEQACLAIMDRIRTASAACGLDRYGKPLHYAAPAFLWAKAALDTDRRVRNASAKRQ